MKEKKISFLLIIIILVLTIIIIMSLFFAYGNKIKNYYILNSIYNRIMNYDETNYYEVSRKSLDSTRLDDVVKNYGGINNSLYDFLQEETIGLFDDIWNFSNNSQIILTNANGKACYLIIYSFNDTRSTGNILFYFDIETGLLIRADNNYSLNRMPSIILYDYQIWTKDTFVFKYPDLKEINLYYNGSKYSIENDGCNYARIIDLLDLVDEDIEKKLKIELNIDEIKDNGIYFEFILNNKTIYFRIPDLRNNDDESNDYYFIYDGNNIEGLYSYLRQDNMRLIMYIYGFVEKKSKN